MLALHLLVASDAGLTPCQQCCAPGGDCSKAYKGTPGKCCGEIRGQSFCCPGVSYRGPTSGDAKCYNCGSAYRCFSSATAGNVCGVASPTWRHYRGFRGEYSYEGNGGLGVVFIGILFVVVVLSCARGRRDASMPYGVPVGGVPVGGYGYGGYGGGSVAGGAAAGFVGGMLVSDMMHHSHSGYGGDFGGGDGGFAADS